MVITDQAKTYIEKMMEKNGGSTLHFAFAGAGCCGPNYSVKLIDGKDAENKMVVNGVSVSIDEKVVDAVKDLILEFEGSEDDGGLVVSGNTGCC